jgi:hypothetical protein
MDCRIALNWEFFQINQPFERGSAFKFSEPTPIKVRLDLKRIDSQIGPQRTGSALLDSNQTSISDIANALSHSGSKSLGE